MNKKHIAIIILTVSFIFSFSAFANAATPSLKDAFKENGVLDAVAKGGGYETGKGSEQLQPYVAELINVLLSSLGVIFLILMIYAGFMWMTASGDEGKVTKAKGMITAAVIGLIIVISAYAISYFVIQSVSNGALESSSSEAPGASQAGEQN